ncbi:MAG: HAMP domain-containing protein, partial [Deltaproteobacteria bacterium]|nr:HAMP domain-containing protein [Deltaproteobacteria bacterium]
RLLTRNLQILDKKDKFLNTVLEARRYEKNYFLTLEYKDLESALSYVNGAEEQLSQIRQLPAPARKDPRLCDVPEAVEAYKEALMHLVAYYNDRGVPKSVEVLVENLRRHQDEVRRRGKTLTVHAEDMVAAERRNVNELLIQKARYHYIALAEMLALCVFTALFLVFSVNRPLKAIEHAIDKIVRGDYENIPPLSKGDEFEALVASVNHMINELNRRTDQLIQTKKMASLGTLTSGVAHELNNPLNNISTSVQILLEELDEGDIEYQREQLLETEKQVERARDIVKALLEFSRGTAYTLESVDVRNLVEDTLKLIKGEVPANVEIHVDIPDGLQGKMDPRQMQQVLINLATNGIQAMKAGGTLHIRGFQSPEESGICIQVRDSGTGIRREDLSKVFDPFFTTKEVGHGTGLGMALSHGIVKKHGGRIDVESEVGKGTTFTIFLPDHSTFLVKPGAAGHADRRSA